MVANVDSQKVICRHLRSRIDLVESITAQFQLVQLSPERSTDYSNCRRTRSIRGRLVSRTEKKTAQAVCTGRFLCYAPNDSVTPIIQPKPSIGNLFSRPFPNLTCHDHNLHTHVAAQQRRLRFAAILRRPIDRSYPLYQVSTANKQ